MTRKKFVKQCMAMGIGRNDAVECATVSRQYGLTYSKGLARMRWIVRQVNKLAFGKEKESFL